MKKFWKFILTIIITVAAYGYEAYDFGSEAHEAISLLQGQLEVKLLDVTASKGIRRFRRNFIRKSLKRIHYYLY